MRRLALWFAGIAPASIGLPLHAQLPPGTTILSFNGYCDGVTITVSGNFTAGTHDNYDCKGSQTFLAGVAGKDLLLAPKTLPSVRANVSDSVGPMINGCPENLYLDFTNNGRAFYQECDGVSPESLVHKGTFTIAPGKGRALLGLPVAHSR